MRDIVPEAIGEQRKSVGWFAQRDISSPLKGKLFGFYQDFQVRVVPYGGRARERPFRVTVEPETNEVAERVVRAVASCSDTPYGDLQSHVCGFITNAATRILLYGDAVCEAVNASDGHVYFVWLPPGLLVPLGPLVVQVVPPNAIEKTERRIIWLKRSDLWWLRFPPGVRRTLSNLRSTLRSVEAAPPPWSLPSVEDWAPEFDLRSFIYEIDVLTSKSVREWGWPVPNTAQRQMTNFHQLHEHVRFAITMARIREHLLRELNRELNARGQQVLVKMTGIPDSAELEAARRSLEEGTALFSDVIATTTW